MGFQVLWRLAILAIPWQTRWIIKSGTLAGGFPWEQGTIAVYASWVLILAAAAIGLITSYPFKIQDLSRPARPSPSQPVRQADGWRAAGGAQPRDTKYKSSGSLIAFLVLLAVSFFTSSRIATLLWWTHVLVLSLFVWALIAMRVDRVSLARWFVLALVPVSALGVWQFAAQDVFSSTLLGIAAQHPWVSGVSVVEHGLYRVLRAYGSFPHPNIFGGWLAVGLTLLPGLARRTRSNLETLWLTFAGVFLSLALVLTFSRGAWLAALVGVGAACWSVRRSGFAHHERQAVGLVLIAILLATVAGLVSQWDHAAARFRPSERLERWSLEQRKTALEEGVRAWLKRPLAGWGPGASRAAVLSLRPQQFPSKIAPEPPHAVPLAALVETGALGFAALVVFLGAAFSRRWDKETVPVLAVFSVLLLSDHYLWTLWPGQALAALGWFFLFTTFDSRRADPRQEGQ